MKIAINSCFGGFGISEEAVWWLRERGSELGNKVVLKGEKYSDGAVNTFNFEGWHIDDYNNEIAVRTDPLLIQCIEELGKKASGRYSNIVVLDTPDGVEVEIEEYDGLESVHEKHRSWG